MATYGENFKRIRDQQKAGIPEIARALRLRHPGNLYILERGDHVPDPKTVLKHARVLGCRPSELLRDVETEYDRIKRGEFDGQVSPQEAVADYVARHRPPAKRRRKASS